MYYSIEDLFRSLGGKTTNDFRLFTDWLRTMGSRTPEPIQLEWILNNPQISERTKMMLAKAINKQTSTIDAEKNILLRVGSSTEEYEESIEKSQKRIEEMYSKMRTGFILLSGLLLLAFFLCYASYAANPRDFGAFTILEMLFFGLAVVLLTQVWDCTSKIKESRERAVKLEEESVGRRAQMRIEAIEKEERRLYELDKAIVKNGVENADHTESTSVA